MPITSDLTPRPDFNADENLAHLTEALAPFGFTAGSGKAAESGPPEPKVRGLSSNGKRNPSPRQTTPGYSFSSPRREHLKSLKERQGSR